MALSPEEQAKLKQSYERRSNFGGKHYSGNKKEKLSKKKKAEMAASGEKPVKKSKVQRKLGHMTSNERAELFNLKKQADDLFIANSRIGHKESNHHDGTEYSKGTKSDIATPGELRVAGVHSTDTWKTYRKRVDTFLKFAYENFGVKTLEELDNPTILGSFLESHISKNSSAKTIGSYMSGIKKLVEIGNSDRGFNVDMSGLLSDKSLYENRFLYKKEDYRRGKTIPAKEDESENKKQKPQNGYTLREAQIIAKHAGKLFSPREQALVEVFTYGAPRADEVLGIKWRQLDFGSNRVYLDDDNQNKNGRIRFIELPEKTMETLRDIWDSGIAGNNKETRIWGSKMNETDVRNIIKDACASGKVGYSALHDFRKANNEYIRREVKSGRLTREELADRTMAHVSIKDKNGNMPLNPIVNKVEIRYRKDEKGKSRPYKVIDNTVKEPLFTREKLLAMSDKMLIKAYMAQVLGHNRTSSVNPYDNG
ncbi:tyrosine-type recombinase/integrase (plasmid) [Paenibacillus urinalis]|uniref:Tyrosine-type recombinase/integrase n=1 Tax=Paenibacillus urinalis TaxID=521520 RepID=A0AAX3N7E6_9BACL|nr:tyrosine-type recombinase/integrase [Paenibacillus urinalis]WDH85532.1 tyrosine-type recombinase/integrase [Paenibacillus urinalis]WDI00120.1 tyrosine-type recombinase/integrase [Paenibacillus urinalis]WDI00133.1 tyrosine-type recombinase/integrase [Paenibacillus urinalis]WDI05431.1 tyrosine-type recombinase/integrase [Paenibacillus urinalis]